MNVLISKEDQKMKILSWVKICAKKTNSVKVQNRRIRNGEQESAKCVVAYFGLWHLKFSFFLFLSKTPKIQDEIAFLLHGNMKL